MFLKETTHKECFIPFLLELSLMTKPNLLIGYTKLDQLAKKTLKIVLIMKFLL